MADYNITFIHIKGKNNVSVDIITRLKNIKILQRTVGEPKIPAVNNMQVYVIKVSANDMHTLGTTMLHTEQEWDITCKKLAFQLCHSNNNSFKSAVMSANGILQKSNTFTVGNMMSP